MLPKKGIRWQRTVFSKFLHGRTSSIFFYSRFQRLYASAPRPTVLCETVFWIGFLALASDRLSNIPHKCVRPRQPFLLCAVLYLGIVSMQQNELSYRVCTSLFTPDIPLSRDACILLADIGFWCFSDVFFKGCWIW